ncbi:MAG: ABC transporter ATP-binding protein [Anaerolineales bacterium]|nr:MAG: ABC transporter ATP-binding protein [Chloroflexota bacterium]MBE7436400.1 ABC transporter ATP-binding protein [Anaerolineales bacterium]MCE7858493.1 ABC transporter ATP-binding protein [Chloroflexi bacterium CFX2]MCK6582094.1 ABC transporter ATP-binding protein [Anaerolineales bacterium]
MNGASQLLEVKNLKLHFRTQTGIVQAVDGVDLELDFHRAVVILGESGCGKTSLSKAMLRLLPRNVASYDGKLFLKGKDIMAFTDEEYRQSVRWVGMSLVPQAAMNSLNPVLTVGDQVSEPAMLHLGVGKAEALGIVKKMFQHVGVPADFINRYPFELSGGMRQRVALAMALVTSPNLIILDEPTSALDLLTQANIMNVLKRIKHELGTSFILITHDIATSSELADEVAIMYAGQVVETGEAREFFPAPLHPYSQMLMASVPRLRSESDPMFITGQPPSLINPPKGCRFAARCPFRFEKCDEEPPIIQMGKRKVKCWLRQ